MKIIEDLHIHTRVSKDCKEDPEKYVVAAIRKGIDYLGFSDHLDLDPVDKDFGYYNFDTAYNDYVLLNKKYGDKINFLFGVEVTYQSELEESIKKHIENKPYDYIIGSVHRLEGHTMAGVRGKGFFSGKDEKTAYSMYFEELYRMVNTDFFQIVGHFDVIKRFGIEFYGKFNAEKYRDIIEPILGKMVEKGIVLEINSSGFRQPPKEMYPSKEIFSMYASLGGREIILGSDAHTIEQFGMGLCKAIDITKEIYDFDIVTFIKREKVTLGKLSSLKPAADKIQNSFKLTLDK
jgi:histidinol-phosphatase (PHP family)